MPVRMSAANENADERDKDVANAIRYAVDNGAQVISMSFGKSISPQKCWVDDAVKYAEKKGVLLISSAGNMQQIMILYRLYPSSFYPDKTKAVKPYKSWRIFL